MPKVEIIRPEQLRYPSFRLVWKETGDSDINWQMRIGAYLHWFKQFLVKQYGSHFYFDGYEDIALSGDPSRGRIYGVIHSWFLYENEEQEKKSIEDWNNFILEQQDNEPEIAQYLICPHEHIWIWRHKIGENILPDKLKVNPLDGMGYSVDNGWYHAGVYDNNGDEYFYLHNWETTYSPWLKERQSPLNKLSDLRETLPQGCESVTILTADLSLVTL